eukprot:5672055-Pyramimonas_sp.AAC.1
MGEGQGRRAPWAILCGTLWARGRAAGRAAALGHPAWEKLEARGHPAWENALSARGRTAARAEATWAILHWK